MSNSRIFVRLQVPGLHRWDDAPANREYLRNTHRHLFHIEAECLVNHSNREIEFHDMLDAIRDYVDEQATHMKGGYSFAGMSCEMVAESIGTHLSRKYGRAFTIEVSEDGECGARVFVSAP